MRLIDADALIEDVRKNSVSYFADDFAHKWVDEQPTIEPEPQWIPCRERLPELDEDGYSEKVLTSYENFIGIDICEYRIIDGTGKWYEGDTEESPEDIGLIVNAWMPLPKPYREEQE